MVAEDFEKNFFVQSGYKGSCFPNIPNPSCSREATDSVEIRLSTDAGQRGAIGVSRITRWGGKNFLFFLTKENRNKKGVFAGHVAPVALRFQILT